MRDFVTFLRYVLLRLGTDATQTVSPNLRSFIRGSLKGRSPFKSNPSPLSFEGEGGKGGEVDKQSSNLGG